MINQELVKLARRSAEKKAFGPSDAVGAFIGEEPSAIGTMLNGGRPSAMPSALLGGASPPIAPNALAISAGRARDQLFPNNPIRGYMDGRQSSQPQAGTSTNLLEDFSQRLGKARDQLFPNNPMSSQPQAGTSTNLLEDFSQRLGKARDQLFPNNPIKGYMDGQKLQSSTSTARPMQRTGGLIHGMQELRPGEQLSIERETGKPMYLKGANLQINPELVNLARYSTQKQADDPVTGVDGSGFLRGLVNGRTQPPISNAGAAGAFAGGGLMGLVNGRTPPPISNAGAAGVFAGGGLMGLVNGRTPPPISNAGAAGVFAGGGLMGLVNGWTPPPSSLPTAPAPFAEQYRQPQTPNDFGDFRGGSTGGDVYTPGPQATQSYTVPPSPSGTAKPAPYSAQPAGAAKPASPPSPGGMFPGPNRTPAGSVKASNMRINPELVNLARYATSKRAFVPSDAVIGQPGPQGQGGPQGQPGQGPPPGAGGGMPPGGPQGPPPGAEPPGGANGAPDLMSALPQMIQQSVAQALQQQQMQGGGAGGAGGKAGGKPDPMHVLTDLHQIKHMLLSLFRMQNIPLPQTVLDGPGRDPQTGMPSPNGVGAAGGAQPQGPQGSMGPAPQSAISPVQPMQGAFPQTPGAGGKSAAAWDSAQVHLQDFSLAIDKASDSLFKYASALGIELDHGTREESVVSTDKEAIATAQPAWEFEVGQEVKSAHAKTLSKAAAVAAMCKRRSQCS